MNTRVRYSADELQGFAQRLLIRVGMEDIKALAVARTLVDGDLMGHDTHGLALLPAYIREIENAAMTWSFQTGAAAFCGMVGVFQARGWFLVALKHWRRGRRSMAARRW
jgi:LDH2 family malate/lactate/ureidoglycolate dehydrogenase